MKKKIFFLSAFGAAMFLAFQNCTKASYGAKDSPAQMSSGGTGTGNGYDGKIYVVVSAVPCPDQTNIEAAILVKDLEREAYVIRETCQNVSARPIPPSSLELTPQGGLIYNGRSYEEVPGDQLPQPSGEKYSRLCSREANDSSDRFNGRIQMEISNAGQDQVLVRITLRERSGVWVREISPFFAALRAAQSGALHYQYVDQSGNFFAFSIEGNKAYGNYQFYQVQDVLGFSGRSTYEENKAEFGYSCGALPW